MIEILLFITPEGKVVSLLIILIDFKISSKGFFYIILNIYAKEVKT